MAARKPKRTESEPERGDLVPARLRLREMLALTLIGATLFTLLACLSWGHGENLCGPTGEALAWALFRSFGYAAYLPIFCLGFWAAALFVQRMPDSGGVRFSGILLCLVSFSGLLAHVVGESTGPFPAGGVVGEYIHVQLVDVGGLGLIGARIALIVLTLITFVLATDVAYYASLVAGARWVRRKGVEHAPIARERLLAVAGAARERVRQLVPQGEDEGEEADAAADDERPARRKPRKGYTIKHYDDDGDETDPDASAADEVAEDEEAEYDDGDAEDVEYEDADDAEYEDEGEYDEDGEYEDEDEEEDEGEVGDEEEVEYDEEDDVDEAPAGGVRTRPDRRPPPRVTSNTEPMPEVTAFDDIDASAPARVDGGPYAFPSERLLDDQVEVSQAELDKLLAEKTEVLERTLTSFKVEARVVEIQKGPVISMFEMDLAPGIKVEKVRALEDDLAIALRARSVRIVAPIPGKSTIGVEVPNPIRESVRLKPLLRAQEFKNGTFALPIFLGRDAAGRSLIVDLAKMPHLLVAGATGSGKSVCLNTIIVSLLFTRAPEQVQLILIDPKMVELSQFKKAPHLACPVICDMKRAPGLLEWAVQKMEERYKLLAAAGVRSIYAYNKLDEEHLREHLGAQVDEPDFQRKLPFVVIVVDELADLMMVSAKEVETSIARLAAKSRAVGIHLILATQRPSTNVITGLIKANLPTRIAFMVSSKIDSRVILDVNGAEQLLGEGDMLFLPPRSSHVVRGQATYLSDEEVNRVMKEVSKGSGPQYVTELVQRRNEGAEKDPTEIDELYDAAVRFILETQRGSASLLQRKFAIGYTRASRLIDLMAAEGVLGEYKGSQAREVTMTLEEWINLNPEARGVDEEEA